MVNSFLHASLVALALLATATTTPTSAQQVACSARASPGDVAVGIDMFTDATCVGGGLGCLGTVCRFCKKKETPSSQHLMSCPSEPAVPSDTTSPVEPDCSALLSAGDRAVGISVARDAACNSDRAGAGCIGGAASSCRFCRELETPQSKHLPLCSAIISPRGESMELGEQSVQALRASTTTTQEGAAQSSERQGAASQAAATAVPVVGAAVAAAVAVMAFAAKRTRDRAADDALVTPTNALHRNEPLCTL